MEFRQLAAEHAEQVRALRIRAVTEYPSAFGASAEDESALSIEQVASQLAAGPPHSFTFGALSGARLIGVLNLVRYQRAKVAHKAMLGGMYVLPAFHGCGFGWGLLQHTLAFARTLPGLETITLAVTAGNASARHLYLRAGFIPFGIEPRYIRVGDAYYDIEWMYVHLNASQAGELQAL